MANGLFSVHRAFVDVKLPKAPIRVAINKIGEEAIRVHGLRRASGGLFEARTGDGVSPAEVLGAEGLSRIDVLTGAVFRTGMNSFEGLGLSSRECQRGRRDAALQRIADEPVLYAIGRIAGRKRGGADRFQFGW